MSTIFKIPFGRSYVFQAGRKWLLSKLFVPWDGSHGIQHYREGQLTNHTNIYKYCTNWLFKKKCHKNSKNSNKIYQK